MSTSNLMHSWLASLQTFLFDISSLVSCRPASRWAAGRADLTLKWAARKYHSLLRFRLGGRSLRTVS